MINIANNQPNKPNDNSADERIKRGWYVIRTAGGKEKKVNEYIEHELEKRDIIKNNLFQILIPTEKYYQIKNGKRVSAERSFFPGYVLVDAIPVGSIQAIIKDLPYVAGFVTEGKDKDKIPVPLRSSEVDRILGRVDSLADQDEETIIPFVIGESVKIIDGPFSGFDGTINAISDDKRKLGVEVKIFGRKTVVELNFAQVTKELSNG